MKMKPITILVLLIGAASGIAEGQVNQSQADDLTRMLAKPSCRRTSQSGPLVCETVLSGTIDTKKNKAGDHILVRTNLRTSSQEEPITLLDAAIVEVQSGAKGRSELRIRINRAVRKDGRELPVEATVVALASKSNVIERWDLPFVIADRFPRIPEDDQRVPGERKLSEDQPHTSSLDSMSDIPAPRTVVCLDQAKKSAGNPCVDLLEARGVYGYKTVTLESVDQSSPAESVFRSKKNIRLVSGTVLVLEMKSIPPIF